MDAPARIKKEDQRREGTKEIAPQNAVGGRGCADCFKEGEIRRKRPERGSAGWRGRGGKREKQTAFPLHPEAWRLR